MYCGRFLHFKYTKKSLLADYQYLTCFKRTKTFLKFNSTFVIMNSTEQISILGCGWLGMPLVEHFVSKGFKVKGSTTSISKMESIKSLGAEPYLINIEEEFDSINQFLSSDILVITITSKNVEAFKLLIHEVEKSEISKVLFIGSTSVYPFNNDTVNEDTETINSALSTIEQLFRNSTSFKTTILRFGGLFDEHRHPAKFIKRASQFENANGRVNLIHKLDCIKCIDAIIHKNVWNDIFNACSDEHPTREEFYTKQIQNLGLETPKFKQTVPPKFKIVNSKKIKQQLSIEFDFEDLMSF